MKRIAYFATGSAQEAAADLARLNPSEGTDSLRVIVPAGNARELQQLSSLNTAQLLIYRRQSLPMIWLRLFVFLRRSASAEIVCLKSPRQYRLLKFFAMALPGRLIFSDGTIAASPACGRLQLLWTGIAQALAGDGPICVVASASPARLRAIITALRHRAAETKLHGLLPASAASELGGLFDSFDAVGKATPFTWMRLLPRCLGTGRWQEVVIPFTNEDRSTLKWMAWWLPCLRVAVYNENLDVFSGRNFISVIRHALWRMTQQRECQRLERDATRKILPVGVVGSASGYYLKKIIPVVRARFPEARLHALLPASLEQPAQGLFDSVTILRSGFWPAFWQSWKVAKHSGPFQCWIVPCTDEPYRQMKLLAFLLPLTRRNIYNELADGFPVRELRTFWGHLVWRARDQLSFQIVASTAGRVPGMRVVHLVAYGVRLMAAAPLLWRARLRYHLSQRQKDADATPVEKPGVDAVYLHSGVPERNGFGHRAFDPHEQTLEDRH